MSLFQVLQEDFIENVNLQTLIPKLNGRGLLTRQEEQQLRNETWTLNHRIATLTQILHGKGPDAPRIVLECLQEERSHAPHAVLATKLRQAIQANPNQAPHRAHPDPRPDPPHPRVAFRDYPHSSIAGGIPRNESDLLPASSPEVVPQVHSHVQCQRREGQCFYGVSVPLPVQLGHQQVVADGVSQLGNFNPQYQQLIVNLSAELRCRGIPFQAIVNSLDAILCNDGSHPIPANIGDFPSLCMYLHNQGMCHEMDVDLLCKLLEELRLEDLKRSVHDYAEAIMDANVVQHQHPPAQSSQNYFLAFTYHNLDHMTVGQVYRIKDAMSDLLGIPPHMFTLVSSQPGSVILVWQLPIRFSKHCLVQFEEPAAKSKLAGRDLSVSWVKFHYPNSSEPQIVFENANIGRRSAVEEECVSSTTDDLTHPLRQHSTYPRPATSKKRKRSTSPCRSLDSREIFHSKRRHPSSPPPCAEENRGFLQQLEASPTSSKRRAHVFQPDVELHGYFRDTSPPEYAAQYVQEPTFIAQEEAYYGFTNVLKKHQPELVRLINLPELVPYLNRHELLTNRENEILQNNMVPHHDRVLNLLRFIEKKEPDGYEKFLQALKEETSHMGHRQVVKLLTAGYAHAESPYKTLKHSLKGTYKSKHFYRRAAGPHVGKIEFVRLALVKKQRASEDEKKTDQFLKSTLHGLVDDIEKRKESIDMYEIFQYGKDPRKLVLVEGAPGVGKTMLAMKLCEDWANGETLKEFELVILVPLRRFQGESKITVEDLVTIYLGENKFASEVSQELVKSGGEKVLFILEGWDELSPNLRQEFTFFFDIIMANQLSQASVMVTSRPTVTAPLYDYMDERRIEVLGFNKMQKQQYVHTHVPDKAAMVLDHLKKFPNLNALAHIPLTLAIICHVVKETDTLPPTLTQLYDGYICNTLFQNLKRQPEFKTLLGIGSLKDLPGEAPAVIRKLCQLALQGFKEKAFVFYAKDLGNAGLNPSGAFDGYGLLSTPVQAATAGHQLLYQFRHLSIQEFLAALQIQELESDDRIHLLREYRQDKQFQNVWRFLSGITKLQDEELQNLIISGTGLANRDQLFLLHCVFEAHNTEICHAAAEKLNHTLNLNNMTLNTTDCLCAAYTVANACGEWNIDLRGCNIGADGLEVFKWNFTRCDSSELKVTTLNLTHNQIDANAVSHLAEMISANVYLGEIDLSSNKMKDEGAHILAKALETNGTVVSLHFSKCGLTYVTAAQIASTLRQNKTLKNIYFGFEPIGDRGVINLASALEHNESLEEISLSSTEMSIGGLRRLAEMLSVNSTLEIIRLDRNNLGVEECQVVADIIAHNDKLANIDLSKNPIGDEGFYIIMDALIAKPQSPLKKLGVFGCEITDKALPKLADFFSVTETFEVIQLGHNHLGDEGAEHIARALSLNASKSVKQVLLEDTGMTQKGKNLLAEVCKSQENLDVNFHHSSVRVLPKRYAT